MTRRILVIYNPAAGSARRARLDAIVSRATALGCTVRLMETSAPGHAEILAREAVAAEVDVIAAAGGDGTVNEVVNGLKGKGITLAVIPLGTANVVADEINLDRAPDAIARTLAMGTPRAIRVGLANGRRFIMMAGVGFDANVVASVSLALKKRIGPLAYVWQAGLVGFTGKLKSCNVTVDGVRYVSGSAIACNGRRYGGPFVAAPKASLSDDSLQVVLMRGRGWFSLFRYGLGLMFGKVGAWWDVDIITGREITIEGVDGQPVQADGDIITRLPARISVDPEPVMLIYPA
jgi:diacylglycerol kinase (ATP)